MKKKNQKSNPNKENYKEYGHIAVAIETKEKFENLRFKLIGKEQKEITHDDLTNILINNYKKKN